MLITIVCDQCGWNKQNQKFNTWLNKQCPICGYKVINKADIFFFRFLRVVKAVSDILVFFFPKLKTQNVHVSSAKKHKDFEENR